MGEKRDFMARKKERKSGKQEVDKYGKKEREGKRHLTQRECFGIV